MFGGDIVTFNINFTYVVRVLYFATPSIIKSCSSAAISPDVLLSAAHCLVEKETDPVDHNNIQLTVLGPFANEMMFRVKKAYIHPEYKPNKAYDISLIQAESPLPVKPLEVSWTPTAYNGEDCLAAGFGSRYIHPFQGKLAIPVLSWIPYPSGLILPKPTCALLKAIANENVICILLLGGVGPCGGDSGGPIICNGALHGLLSRGMILGGDNCGAARGILVYESVHAYREWIFTTITKSNDLSSSRPVRGSLLLLTLVLFLSLGSHRNTVHPIIYLKL
uniref:Glandular kallikrein, prostatic n=1 Tax=Lygus hesperus TaxID=30085 RepID=A0A146LQH3_LYGHE